MRAQFEGPAAERYAAAQARVAAAIEAAGGREAWQALNAQKAVEAAARARAQAAAEAVTAAERALADARDTAEQTADAAEGRWTVTLGPVGRAGRSGYLGAFTTYAEAEAAAERSRAAGRGASVLRPYCGHGVASYARRSAEQACGECARKAQR